MRSALTRSVFRRIIRNEPILHHDCIFRTRLAASRKWTPYTQKRTIFGFLRADDDERYQTIIPGVHTMAETNRKLAMKVRTAPKKDLAKAFNVFFQQRLDGEEMVTDLQAKWALRMWEYLQREGDEEGSPMTALDAERALVAMSNGNYGRDWVARGVGLEPAFATLATELFGFVAGKERSVDPELTSALVRALCFAGLPERALASVAELPKGQYKLEDWTNIIRGFEATSDSDGLANAAEIHTVRGHQLGPDIQGAITSAFANVGNEKLAAEWVAKENSSGNWLTASAAAKVLRACAKHGYDELGKEVIRKAMERPAILKSKEWCHAMLVWPPGAGKTAGDKITEMMTQTSTEMEPDIETINELVAYAYSIDDPAVVEQLLDLGAKRGIRPDAKTHLLKLDYQLAKQDLKMALATYERLMDDLSESVKSDDLTPRTDKLILALCSSSSPDHELITDIVEEHHSRTRSLSPETLTALSIYHLRADQYTAAINLLRAHAPNLTISARRLVSSTLAAFCADRRNPIDRVWDTYVILHKTFDEINRDTCTPIMREFLVRRRADMAVHVFSHMRNHYRADTTPTPATYVLALAGIGRLADAPALQTVHNLLKLDLRTDPDTSVYNALMLAYTGCDDARHGLEFWQELLATRDGPNRNSVLIALWACENAPFGERAAVEVWREVEARKMSVDGDVLAAYAAALAANGRTEQAMEVMRSAGGRYGVQPTAAMLGNLLQATSSQAEGLKVAEWIQAEHGDVWKELTEAGIKINPVRRRFVMQRDLRP